MGLVGVEGWRCSADRTQAVLCCVQCCRTVQPLPMPTGSAAAHCIVGAAPMGRALRPSGGQPSEKAASVCKMSCWQRYTSSTGVVVAPTGKNRQAKT